MEIRRSYNRLISTMGFLVPTRYHLYIESGPWYEYQKTELWPCIIFIQVCFMDIIILFAAHIRGKWKQIGHSKLYSWILTLYVPNFQRKHKHIFTFYFISSHWYDTSSWNSSSRNTGTYSFYIVKIMAADVLATQGARASATLILT